ncbi:hypothetical protein GCM10009526_07080 [Glutamicibacter creatinolyticus]
MVSKSDPQWADEIGGDGLDVADPGGRPVVVLLMGLGGGKAERDRQCGRGGPGRYVSKLHDDSSSKGAALQKGPQQLQLVRMVPGASLEKVAG